MLETDEDFSLPRIVTHGANTGYEFSRRGYVSRRRLPSSRGRHGVPGAARTTPRGEPHRIGARSRRIKSFLFGPFQSFHAAAPGAWTTARSLSMYQCGLFDEWRMHGVPSAVIRFPELVMLQASYSINIFDVYRLDLFADHARGRDPYGSAGWQPVTGTGFALTMKVPWNSMMTVDVGKSFIPGIYRGTGSFVMQILVLKPL